jgi:SMC interacting uncharacterized protein involved in chromosome segregation
VALPAVRLEVENDVEAQFARLEEKVDRLQSDMTEVKTDIRRVDSKADAIRDALAAFDSKTQASIASLELKAQQSIAALDLKIAGLDLKCQTSFAVLDGKIEALDKKLAVSLEKIGRSRLADKIWWLLIGATILGVMARGFKWI